MSELSEKVEGIVNTLDISDVLRKVEELADGKEEAERQQLVALVSAEVFKKISEKLVETLVKNDETAKRNIVPAILSTIFKDQPFEVRFWTDLLYPDRAQNFDNTIPEQVWEQLMEVAQKISSSPDLTDSRQAQHLKALAQGIIPVPVQTSNWRQWISINALALSSDETKQALFEKLTFDNLSLATQNFLNAFTKESHA